MSSISPGYYRELVLAGLLHDVGKLLQRADACTRGSASGNHVKYSKDFLDKVRKAIKGAGLRDDVVEQFITTHHENGPLSPFDRAAACERKLGDDVSGESLVAGLGEFNNVPFMWSLNGGVKYVAPEPLSIIAQGGQITPKDKASPDEVCSAYQRSSELLDKLANAVNQRKFNFWQLMETLVHVLKATTLFTPAAVYGVKVADTSLFAHSILTAALASAEVTGGKFRFLGIDVHGIQQYITRVHRTRFASYALRGRSLYITLLQRILVDLLIDKLNDALKRRFGDEAAVVTRANVLIDTGGEVTMLVPALPEEDMEKVARDLENMVVSKTQGQLRVTIAWTDEKPVDCSVFQGDGFRNLMKELSDKLRERRFRNYVDYKPQVIAEGKCDMCGAPASKLTEFTRARAGTTYTLRVCELCKKQLDLGEQARNLVAVVKVSKCVATEYPCTTIMGQPLIVLGGRSIELSLFNKILTALPSDVGIKAIYLVNNTTDFIMNLDNVGYGYIFTNSHLPSDEAGLKTADELGRYLFTIRIDGNNMGMNKYRAQETPSKYVTFSNVLSLVFEAYAGIRARRYSDDVYVIYSGGDDAALVGNQNALSYVSDIINYAEKWGFKVGGGAVLDEAEAPVLFTWEGAREAEDEAKDISRDESIFVLTHIGNAPLALKATELASVYQEANELYGLIRNNEVGGTLLFRLMGIIASMYQNTWLLSKADTQQVNAIRRELVRNLVNYAYIMNRRSKEATMLWESGERFLQELTVENMTKLIQPLLTQKDQAGAVRDALNALARMYTRIYLAYIMRRNEKQTT